MPVGMDPIGFASDFVLTHKPVWIAVFSVEDLNNGAVLFKASHCILHLCPFYILDFCGNDRARMDTLAMLQNVRFFFLSSIIQPVLLFFPLE